MCQISIALALFREWKEILFRCFMTNIIDSNFGNDAYKPLNNNLKNPSKTVWFNWHHLCFAKFSCLILSVKLADSLSQLIFSQKIKQEIR